MRRILIVFLLLGIVSSVAWAQFDTGSGIDVRGKIFHFHSTNSTGADLSTTIATSLINVGARIVGVSISKDDNAKNSENWVSIRDTVFDQGETYGEVIGEAERQDDNLGTEWFSYPVGPVQTQVSMVQGANTTVALHYVR